MQTEKYDIFISFKNTDESGARTEDSYLAEEIYNALKSRGFSAFYSNIILLEQGAAAYKNTIEQALEDSRVLIAIGTKKEYLASQWVSYERESFHNDILSGRKKGACIVPYLKNIHGTDVPRSLRNYQTFDISMSPVSDVVAFVASFLKDKVRSGAADPSSSRVSLSTGKHSSVYSAEKKTETKRLKIQAKNTRDADMPAINYALEKLSGKEHINILDMGCAYGYVTADRFGDIENATVVGIDRGEQLIDYAKTHAPADNFHYYVVDLESDELEDKLDEILEEQGIRTFDIIFASLVIHHLTNPNKLLRKMRKYLSRDGYIIIRGSDDGSIVPCNDDGLIQKIVDLHLSCDGISDRLNGRKIYSQLISSGYKNVRMMNYIKEISGLDLDERNEIFVERFSYRRNYIAKECERDPYNMSHKKKLEEMDFLLSELENKFDDETFWYSEIDFVGVAMKK